MTPAVNNTLSQYYLKVQALTPQDASVTAQANVPPPDTSLIGLISQPLPLALIIFFGLVILGGIALFITKVRNVNTILTLLFLALMTSAIPFGTQLARQETRLSSQASPVSNPKNLVVTQLQSGSFSVLWDTDAPNIGAIRLRTTIESSALQKVLSEKESDGIYKHAIEATGLKPDTDYYFEVLSGGEWYNLNGQPLKVHTPPNP